MSDPNPVPDFTTCPHWGKAGRYVVSPTTGRREPMTDLEATDPAPVDPTPEAATDKPTRKGK